MTFGQTRANPVSRFAFEVPTDLLRGTLPGHSRGLGGYDRDDYYAGDAGAAPAASTLTRRRPSTPSTPAAPPRASISWSQASRPQKVEPPAAGSDEVWKSGDRVEHSKFGLGTVVGVRGEGGDAVVQVAFPGIGVKQLVSKYAALRRAE
jgi:DNA helicase-2/ATP-dependent DNA helicase PcrA